MILRKPYAFFIKLFKPVHILLSILIGILIYKTSNILNFFNEYIYTNKNIPTGNIKQILISNSLFVIPIILIAFSLIFLGIMFLKEKPIKFYIINVFSFLVVLVLTVYTSNFLSALENSIASIKTFKIHHDLISINMIVECVLFVCFVIRGLGINFKKFNFDSDTLKFNITDLDNEEFEVNLNLNLDSAKRKRKTRIRYLKYTYKENKLLINFSITIFAILLITFFSIIVFSKDEINTEGVNYNIGNFDMFVNKTIITKESFKNKIITENNLIVVETSLKSWQKSVSLFAKDFSLEIGTSYFNVVNQYDELMLDLGNSYKNNTLTQDYKKYLLIFEIPDKYITSDMFLIYNNKGDKIKIKLEPIKLNNEQITSTKKIGETLSFDETLNGISFNIENYDIKQQFIINYKYCFDNDCILSKEYLKPTINENFDKVILKLKVNFVNKSMLELNNFYEFFSKFGFIQYKKGDSWYLQNSNFEELKSVKVDNHNNIYIGINENVIDNESIKLVFYVRNSKYEYVLK